MNIYKRDLIDHYQQPRNKGVLQQPNFWSIITNPSCGDSVTMQGFIQDGIITKIVFDGAGCIISQAVASLLTEVCLGKVPSEILALTSSSVQEIVGVPLGPTRLKCALLPLQTLQEALIKYGLHDKHA